MYIIYFSYTPNWMLLFFIKKNVIFLVHLLLWGIQPTNFCQKVKIIKKIKIKGTFHKCTIHIIVHQNGWFGVYFSCTKKDCSCPHLYYLQKIIFCIIFKKLFFVVTYYFEELRWYYLQIFLKIKVICLDA